MYICRFGALYLAECVNKEGASAQSGLNLVRHTELNYLKKEKKYETLILFL